MTTRQIPLSRGLFATVDEADYEWLSQWKWSTLKTGRKGAPPKFYAVRMERKSEHEGRRPRMILMHRALSGAGGDEVTDHENRNTLDNTRLNLRTCTQAENSLNHTGHRDRASRFKGVSWYRNNRKWVAEFRGKYIGSFSSEELAAAAYDKAAITHSPRFALANMDMGG